jgi:opacity protein-like surface antigen
MYKKIVLVLIAVFVTASYAQAQFTFGARAGFNLTNMSMKDYEGKKPDGDAKPLFKPGFQIGVVGEYAFNQTWAIQPGILFATQGYKLKSETAGIESKSTFNLNYLQVPINAQYKLDLGSMKLLLQAGPYLGYAFGGKIKSEADGTKADDVDIKFGSKEDEMKAFDFGVGVGAGLQFLGNMQVGLGYNVGLMNLANRLDEEGADDKSATKNNGLAITFTYMFGKK